MMAHIARLGLILIIAAFGLAACGSGDPTPTPTAVPATPTPTAESLPAWQVEWNSTLEAARSEGKVNVWTGGGGAAAREHLETAFESDFPGIDVIFFQAPRSSERDSRYLQEREAGVAQVDIFVGGSAGVNARVKPVGGLQPLEPFLILPEVTDRSNWKGGEWIWVDEEELYMMMSAPTSAPSMAIADSVDIDSIRSWQDLLRPEFRGEIIMQDPRESGAGFARGLFWYFAPHFTQEPVLRDFVTQLWATGDVTFSPDRRAGVESLVNGTKLINISPDITEWEQLQEIGRAPRLIDHLPASEGGTPLVQASDSSGILFVPNIDLPNPNAAKVYANWFYSQSGQQALVDIRDAASNRVDVDISSLPDFIVPPPGAQVMNLNHHTASELVTEMRDHVTASLPN